MAKNTAPLTSMSTGFPHHVFNSLLLAFLQCETSCNPQVSKQIRNISRPVIIHQPLNNVSHIMERNLTYRFQSKHGTVLGKNDVHGVQRKDVTRRICDETQPFLRCHYGSVIPFPQSKAFKQLTFHFYLDLELSIFANPVLSTVPP